MKRLWIGFLTMMGAMAIVLCMGFLSRLSSETIELFAIVVLANVIIALAGFFVLTGSIFWQKYRLVKAKADEAIHKARIIDTSDGTWFIQRKLPDGSVDIASLHNNPLWEINGHRAPVTQAELYAWQAYNKRGQSSKEIGQLQSGVITNSPKLLDFSTVMTDPLQAYAIIGPQRIGKSVLLQQLTRQLTNCIVIGTKAKPDEWANCNRHIGSSSDMIVPNILNQICSDSSQRIMQNVNTPLITIILDDWLNTAELWPEIAEKFFVEAATRMLTAGYVPYFVLQSDSKNDWGIKHGAQLKNNFTHLMLKAPRVNGHIDHSQLEAFIIYPGDKIQHQVRLPYSIHPDLILQPQDEEGNIVRMAQEGKSFNEIARQVFGSIGGYQTRRIKEILAKYGM